MCTASSDTMKGLIFLAGTVAGLAFSKADVELTDHDVRDFGSIGFSSPKTKLPCKVFPGDAAWPSAAEWSRLNASVGGALLSPLPAASACYSSSPGFDPAKCEFLLTNASRTTFYLDDPLTILTQWPQGNTCLASRNPTGNCTQGGFPSYVVNATSVKQVQAAVNFARNKGIRLVIK